MTAEFYLFDVEMGQAAALKLPNGSWCMFDIGKSSSFSPVNWIVNRNRLHSQTASLLTGITDSQFRFFKSTISHYHGDHLGDALTLFRVGTDYFRSVDHDLLYLNDCYTTCSDESKAIVTTVVNHIGGTFGPSSALPDYSGALISELSLPVDIARNIGGSANSRVNNASIVTRIDVYGNSILLCGDVEKEAWKAIINDSGDYGKAWRPFLANIDILIAPHHGHKSGYSIDLLNLASPSVVLASVPSKDTNVDSRYSSPPVKGILIDKVSYSLISTRKHGHIKVSIENPDVIGRGSRSWSFGDDAIN
ncbi:MAG TPA: hypothetical protein PLP05_08820 [Sedimentisphaerales bacterium]|nr:hypothetical protein [Sedimentisphaerales bacterium]